MGSVGAEEVPAPGVAAAVAQVAVLLVLVQDRAGGVRRAVQAELQVAVKAEAAVALPTTEI